MVIFSTTSIITRHCPDTGDVFQILCVQILQWQWHSWAFEFLLLVVVVVTNHDEEGDRLIIEQICSESWQRGSLFAEL